MFYKTTDIQTVISIKNYQEKALPVSDIHLIYYYARETARSKKRKYIGYQMKIYEKPCEDRCMY